MLELAGKILFGDHEYTRCCQLSIKFSKKYSMCFIFHRLSVTVETKTHFDTSPSLQGARTMGLFHNSPLFSVIKKALGQ